MQKYCGAKKHSLESSNYSVIQGAVERCLHDLNHYPILVSQAFTCFVLESFMETVLSAQRVKRNLDQICQKSTALAFWMKTTFQDFLTIMPIFFDRIHTFFPPLYGFDQQILLEETQQERSYSNGNGKPLVDLDELVLGFLRKQEKAGGTETAVTIVLAPDVKDDNDVTGNSTNFIMLPTTSKTDALQNTSKTLNGLSQSQIPAHRVELGFAINGTTENANNRNPANGEQESHTSDSHRKRWPPIYMRSSTRLTSSLARTGSSHSVASSRLNLISGIRRNSTTFASSVSMTTSTGLMSQSSRTSWTSESPRSSPKLTSRSKKQTTPSLLTHGNVFEYEADSSSQSWPHSEWDSLVKLLSGLDGTTSSANISADLSTTPTGPTAEVPQTNNFSNGMEDFCAATYHPEDYPSNQAANTNEKAAGTSLFTVPDASVPTSPPSKNHNVAPTTIHAVRLNKFMWMAGMYILFDATFHIILFYYFRFHRTIILTYFVIISNFQLWSREKKNLDGIVAKVED